MNFGSAWYFSSAAADSRATRNTLVFQWKPRWERKLGSIQDWFRSFHCNNNDCICSFHNFFHRLFSFPPRIESFRAMVLTWSSEHAFPIKQKLAWNWHQGKIILANLPNITQVQWLGSSSYKVNPNSCSRHQLASWGSGNVVPLFG